MFLLGMVPVVQDGPVTFFGSEREQVLNRIGAALAAAPEWPAAGPPGITWPPPVDGLPESLDAVLARQPPPSAVAWALAAGILGLRNCRARLLRAADAVRPLDTARWTARQRIAAAAVILAGLGAIVPAADPAGTMKYGDLGQALPVILALAALIAGPPGASFLNW